MSDVFFFREKKALKLSTDRVTDLEKQVNTVSLISFFFIILEGVLLRGAVEVWFGVQEYSYIKLTKPLFVLFSNCTA